MDTINVLVVTPPQNGERYRANLADKQNLNVQIVGDTEASLRVLDARDTPIDVLVVDNALGNIYPMIGSLRSTYPRLIIVLVDEEADFGMPGQADDLSTEPFENDDLVQRITRLISERRIETVRSDSLPAVRAFAKKLQKSSGVVGKQQAAVDACLETGYEYVAYYHLESADPLQLALKAQAGPAAIQAIAPKQATDDDLMAWVARSSQTRLAAPQDSPNHPLVARGRLGAAACVPVSFGGTLYGVLAACRDRPGSITQENILMLELIGAQLGGALSKERMGS